MKATCMVCYISTAGDPILMGARKDYIAPGPVPALDGPVKLTPFSTVHSRGIDLDIVVFALGRSKSSVELKKRGAN